MNQPLIKYTGSKRHIAKKIVSYFPDKFDTYYEPFLGGGSVFFEVLKQDRANKYILSDSNFELIFIFSLTKSSSQSLIDEYKICWEEFKLKGPEYYYQVRNEFNENKEYKDPYLFNFLTRTCYNGTIRYNSKGEFNTSCHFSRPGMHPDKFEKIVNYYHELFKGKDIEFRCEDFTKIEVNENEKSVVYSDSPYVGNDTLYQESFNKEKFEKWLYTLKSKQNCLYFFTLNGINKNDNEQIVDSKLFSQKIILNSGNSSFSRLKNKKVDVKEFFYIK